MSTCHNDPIGVIGAVVSTHLEASGRALTGNEIAPAIQRVVQPLIAAGTIHRLPDLATYEDAYQALALACVPVEVAAEMAPRSGGLAFDAVWFDGGRWFPQPDYATFLRHWLPGPDREETLRRIRSACRAAVEAGCAPAILALAVSLTGLKDDLPPGFGTIRIHVDGYGPEIQYEHLTGPAGLEVQSCEVGTGFEARLLGPFEPWGTPVEATGAPWDQPDLPTAAPWDLADPLPDGGAE